ncbi:hypothetical protein FI667_g8877, partial [Globisporangium splendens]
MKISFAVFASLVGTSHAMASPSMISKSDFPRFLQEKTTLEQELQAWKESAAGQFAKQHDFFIAASKTNAQSADKVHEDQVRRFFLTKLHIEQAQQANPDAVFSTDSPFTLMTDEEFAAFVGNSFKRGDSSNVLLNQDLAVVPGDQVDASATNATVPDAVRLVLGVRCYRVPGKRVLLERESADVALGAASGELRQRVGWL